MSIVEKIRDAGIVGCGGAGFPTHAKLKGNIEYLIHIEKNPECNEKTKDYTESHVETVLQEVQENNTGFGREENNLRLIKETVAKAHTSL